MLRINGRTFYAMLKDAHRKDLALWGGEDRDARFISERLSLLGAETARVHDADLEDGALIGSHMIVMLHDGYYEAADRLDTWGYHAGEDYRWIKRYGNENLRTEYMYDPMLGFNTLGDERTPGFFHYGAEPSRGVVRIAVLGGSTADPGSFVGTSWPELLAQVIADDGVKATVYNGAVTGYTSAQELVKLLRDVPAIHPDVIVLYSGINNNHLVSGYPFMIDYQVKLGTLFSGESLPTVNLGRLKPWKGLRYDSKQFNKYEWWVNHMRSAHDFGERIGARTHCILQPNLMTKPEAKLLPEEREYLLNRSFMGRPGLTPNGYREIALGFCAAVAAEQPCTWLHDYTSVFDKVNESVYEDGIHVNRQGNEIIARAVWDTIRADVVGRGAGGEPPSSR